MLSSTKRTLITDIKEFWKSPLKRSVLIVTFFTTLLFFLAIFFPEARKVPFGFPIYVCMFFCLVAMILLINAQIHYSYKKHLGKSNMLIVYKATAVVFVVSVLCWIVISYKSHYDAMEDSYRGECQSTFDSISYIVSSEGTNKEKIARLKDLKIKTRSEINILKNGEKFYTKKVLPKYANYYVRDVIKGKETQDLVVDEDVYSVKYAYYNRPCFSIGIARSITLGSSDYLVHYYEKYVLGKSEKEIIKCDSNGVYFRDKNYQRSMYFWLAFGVAYLIAAVLIYLYIFKQSSNIIAQEGLELEKQELSSENSKLEEALKKEAQTRRELEAKNIELKRFELVYNMMLRNIKHHVEQEPVQTLQGFQFSWQDVVEKKISMGRHAIKNIRENSVLSIDDKMLQQFIEFTDDAVIQPTVEKILQKLREVSDMVDTELTFISTNELYYVLKTYLLENCFDDVMSQKYISVNVDSNNLSDDGKCLTNIQIMKNVVENLINNTIQVLDAKIERLWEESDDGELDDLKCHINILMYEKDEHFVIKYSDDVKGFPDDILCKIYHEPITSSKDEERKGEGTMYVSFFIEHMGGYVKAENGMSIYGRKEAITTLSLPLIKGE